MSQAQAVQANKKYEKLINLLKELFQLDQPDLDFGLYRIMHAKSSEITQFLDKDLLPQVQQAFNLYKSADSSELLRELAKVIEQAHSLGADPETLPKVRELRHKLTNDAIDVGALENEVYDNLFSFFRRYYSEGDFLAKRVYKSGVYAIPYEGEEVKLHWANRDQYYIKTSEYLRDYAFRLRPDDGKRPMRVHFRLADVAEGEHGNIKPVEGKDRQFILASDTFIAEENGDLVIHFEYRAPTLNDWPPEGANGKQKPPGEKDLVAMAVKRISSVADGSLVPWLAELAKAHVDGNGKETGHSKLEAHLKQYVAKNTFDYFIHKDLSGFLRRELDFYVKNEVMHLDDVADDTAARVEQYLSKIKVIRAIASKIIDFLAQLEDFQKKLWLKKKFVVETSYCISLSIIPEAFYPEILANDTQREEWVRLCAINECNGDLTTPGYSVPLSSGFLKAQTTLMVDTRHFKADFTARLLDSLSDLDGLTDGQLINSENFQALNLMARRYAGEINVVYADPPYNTSATEILYKNSYKHSSWLSMLADRIGLVYRMIADGGIACITIDDFEFHRLRSLLEEISSPESILGIAAIKNNPSGRATAKGFSIAHEYAVFLGKGETAKIGRLKHSEEQIARYKDSDTDGQFEWVNFRKHGGANANRTRRPKLFYPILVSESSIRIPKQEWNEANRSWTLLEEPRPGEAVVFPTTPTGAEKTWKLGIDTARLCISDLKSGRDQAGRLAVYRKARVNEGGTLPRTIWDKKEYSSTEYGTNLLARIFGEKEVFPFPKSLYAVSDCLTVAGSEEESVVLDFFAGSGTTGHACILLNRQDGGNRRFILVEMGKHLADAIVPRIEKITFSPEWKDGKPARAATPEEAESSPRIVKIVRLESYEDALNNLEIRRSPAQQTLLDENDASGAEKLKEQYMLRYMLDVETKGSPSLLNVQGFQDPTAYKLRAKPLGSDESREADVDLLETFNWLIGLTVQHIAAPQSFTAEFERDTEKRLRLRGRLKQYAAGPWWFRKVEGLTPDGSKTLIVWRKLTGDPEQDNLVLDVWMKDRLKISTKDFEFDLIYVNGGNNLENLRLPDDTWKVRLIEEDFHRLMFDTESL